MLRSLRAWWLAGWRSLPIDGALRVLTAVFLLVVAVVPVVGNELRVQDVDPVYMRNMVERVAAFGGTYYENSIHNRGPLEPLLYDVAGRVISYDGFWFAISLMVALLAGFVGWAAARTARWTGAGRAVALAVAGVVYVQLALANHGFSRVLYVRNITTALLVGVWVLALSERCWSDPRRARWTSIAVGALLGLVVEQLLTSVFAGTAVGLVALLLMYERRGREEGRRHEQAAVVAAVLAFLAAPAWYLARGSLDEYWSGWWVYARHMSTGTGRSLGSQLSLGWDQLYAFHRASPLVVLLLLAFVGTTWLLWPALDRRARIVHLGLLGWWGAGWIELVLSQRYTPHYYAVIGIPLALMGAALAGHAARVVAARRPSARATLALPLAATVLAIFLSGPTYFVDALEETRDFRGVAARADKREKELGGGDRSVRAVLDLVSDEHSALLAWTFDPFVYPKYRRVPATRFQWKSLLLGEIYLGLTRPEHVLPDTWRWFAEDLEESDPVAFVETEPFESATPFEDVVRAGFTEVYPGSAATVWLRRDAADELLAGGAPRPWRDPGQPSTSAWTVEGDEARFALGTGEGRLHLGSGPCRRIEGTFDVAAPGAAVDVTFRFDDPGDPGEEPQHLTLEGPRAGSGSEGLGPLGFESLDVDVPADGPVRVALVIGDRSAALVVEGALRGAVRLPPELMRVSLESRTPDLTVSELRVGDPPPAGSCRSSSG